MMFNKNRIFLIASVFATLLVGHKHALAHEGHQPLPTKGVQVDTEQGHITLSGQARDAIGLETAEVVVGEVSSRHSAFAETVAPWYARAFGSAQISGRITKFLVRPGDDVAKGQVIAELTSRELESLQLEYSQAKTELALNQQLLEMTRPSATAGAIPMQRLLEIENAFLQSENSIAMTRHRARTLGVAIASLDQDERLPIRHLIRSPIAGKVVHSDLSEGKFVEAFEHLFEIISNDETWVRLQLLEKDIAKVAVGQRVELQFDHAGAKVEGQIDRLDAGLEPMTQVARAWVTISNPAVVPGMVGNAIIHTKTQRDRIAVPLRAVHSDGLQSYVLVEEAATNNASEYRKQSVKIGSNTVVRGNEVHVEIDRGDVYPGDRVVVTGGHELSSLFFLGVLKLTEADRERLGIKTVVATQRSIANAIAIPAIVTLPPEGRSVASSQLAGTIHSHSLLPGRTVQAGETLVEITSPEFYGLQLDLLETVLDADQFRLRAGRLKEVSDDAVSRRVVLETMARADQLESRAESLKRQLVSLGLNENEVDSIAIHKQIQDYLPIRSAIAGSVISWGGTLGETVSANQSLVEVQNLSSLWVEAHLPPPLRTLVREDSKGVGYLLSNPDFQFPVAVERIAPIVSDATRTQRVWLKAGKPSAPATEPTHTVAHESSPVSHVGILRDGMPLTVILKSGEGATCLAIPSSAVLRDGAHHFVFVHRPDTYIERRRVIVGRGDGVFVEILDGVIAGDAVVSVGCRDLQTAYASLR